MNYKQAYNFNFYILKDLAQIQVQIAGQIDVLYRNLFFVALSFWAVGNSKRVWWTVLKAESRAKVDGPFKSGRSWAKLNGHLSQSERSRTILDGFLSQSGRSWVQVDGHSTKSAQPLGIKDTIAIPKFFKKGPQKSFGKIQFTDEHFFQNWVQFHQSTWVPYSSFCSSSQEICHTIEIFSTTLPKSHRIFLAIFFR